MEELSLIVMVEIKPLEKQTNITVTKGKSVRTVGDMTWDGTSLVGNKLKFTGLDITNGSIDNLNISSSTIPDNSLAITIF